MSLHKGVEKLRGASLSFSWESHLKIKGGKEEETKTVRKKTPISKKEMVSLTNSPATFQKSKNKHQEKGKGGGWRVSV